jgi:dTDP-4-dehydrorhamnose 3,5-epimerase
MKFLPTDVSGALLIEPERREDERGFFARTYCVDELAQNGLDPKVVSCIRGEIYDVVLDLRPASASYRRWAGAKLTADNHQLLFVPKGCAHGFITLTDDAIVHYEISEFHHPESARGVRYDDPAFGIVWPLAPVVVHPRDLAFEPYRV